MVVRIFYFQLEVSNEASKSCLVFIARTYNIAIGYDADLAFFDAHVSTFRHL
jgi:hypothetical protein